MATPEYTWELDLINDAVAVLENGSPWGSVKTITEFPYGSGTSDIVAANESGMVIGIEAKLTDWRKALLQAYRNRSFADVVYVLLPQSEAIAARRHWPAFQATNVGICYLDSRTQSIVIDRDSSPEDPLLPWVNRRALESFISPAKG